MNNNMSYDEKYIRKYSYVRTKNKTKDYNSQECSKEECIFAFIVVQCVVVLIVVLVLTLGSIDTVPHRHGIDMRAVPYEKCYVKSSVGVQAHVVQSVFAKRWDFNQNNGYLNSKLTTIAIGVAITSKKTSWKRNRDLNTSLVFLNKLLPSFCDTASEGYEYNFFLAFDQTDTLFNNQNCSSQLDVIFKNITSSQCTGASKYNLHFIQCKHKGTPARAQNDAMMEAYMLNMEYFYRINDDTIMVTPGWTNVFIATLKAFDPPNVGVVGPKHQGGNTELLTYDFVHYTHIHIHGCYYPHVFSDWLADSWITYAYNANITMKLANITLNHTLTQGTRYRVDPINYQKIKALQINGQLTTEEYKRYINLTKANKDIKPRGDKVIAMCIPSNEARYTYGAIRNAQLIPLYFPDWILRIYIMDKMVTETIGAIPYSVLQKLEMLGAQVVTINSTRLPSSLTKYLVMGDKTTAVSLLLNPDQRISLRLRVLTNHWLSNTNHAIFCVREKGVKKLIVPGLFGAKKNLLFDEHAQLLSIPTMLQIEPFNNDEDNFINKYLWAKVMLKAKCFDNNYPNVNVTGNTEYIPFPVGLDFYKNITLGTLFNEHDEIITQGKK